MDYYDHYIVNPSIKNDQDYYRHDDNIINRVIEGHSLLAVGIRRIGKTSFLNKIERAAKKAKQVVLFCDLGDLFRLENPQDFMDKANNDPEALILLDEAEAWEEWPSELIEGFLKAIKKHTVVITCSPSFFIEMRNIIEMTKYPGIISKYLEPFETHYIGALTELEAEELIGLKKRPGASPLDDKAIRRILDLQERFPIILQAICKKEAHSVSYTISLLNLGQSILSGMTKGMKEMLINIANDKQEIEEKSQEANLLESLGVLKQSSGFFVLASNILCDLIKEIKNIKLIVQVEDKGKDDGRWKRHARIVHLSDLHFGKFNIEPNHPVKDQFERLETVLNRDRIDPDFIVVTGDLSWSGDRDELKLAEEFLERIVSFLSEQRGFDKTESRKRVIIVPGNHEASWILSYGAVVNHKKTPFKLSEEDKMKWITYSHAPYANFINRFYKGIYVWDMECPCMLVKFSEPSICFLALSTCNFITMEKKLGKFGQYILDKTSEYLKDPDFAQARFRIGIWHHNLKPEKGISIEDGDAAFQTFAKKNPSIDFIIHGHVHQGDVDQYQPRDRFPPLPYSSVGSFGVRMEHRPGGKPYGYVPNQFAIIDLETNDNGRRFVTQYYNLDLSIVDREKWVWESTSKKNIRNL
ncbi:MAG: metallophosphoesterase [bacterium]